MVQIIFFGPEVFLEILQGAVEHSRVEKVTL